MARRMCCWCAACCAVGLACLGYMLLSVFRSLLIGGHFVPVVVVEERGCLEEESLEEKCLEERCLEEWCSKTASC